MVNGVGMYSPRTGVKEQREWEEWQNRSSWQGELERVRDCLVVLELCARLGGGRDGAERWYRGVKALLTAVEGSDSYRLWEQQEQQQQRAYHQNQNHHGSNHHDGNRPQQQQRPPLALEPQDRSYLLTLPSPHVHAHATNGKPVDYALARVSVSLIMLLHQSFGAPGSQKLEAVPDDEFAASDWGQHSRRRGSAAAPSAGVGAGGDGVEDGSSLKQESEQARILEWLGWNLPSHGAGTGSNGHVVGVPIDPAITAGGGQGYQDQGMMTQGDRRGSSSAGAANNGYQQGSMGMGMMRMDLGR